MIQLPGLLRATRVPEAPARSILRWCVEFMLIGLIAAVGGPVDVRGQEKKEEVRRENNDGPADAPADADPAGIVPAVQQNAWPDEQFEQWVFQGTGGPAATSKRFEAFLVLQVEEIDRVCRLTEAQKKKLQLIGGGDIKHFFDGYAKVKRRFNQMHNDMQRLNDIMPDVSPLQSSVQEGLFTDASLFSKSLRHTLTAEQFARYETVVAERTAFSHRAQIELAVDMLEQSAPLREAQRRDLIALLSKEIKPPRARQYGAYMILAKLARLPAEKIQPLLTDIQWSVIKPMLAQYRANMGNFAAGGVEVDQDGPVAEPPAK